jgi:hypothetical protein
VLRILPTCILAIVGVFSSSVAAQQTAPASTLFDRLTGHWVLRGTITGEQTVHDVDADLVLNGGYVRLHEVSREKDKKGKPAYEAIVFISVDEKTGVYNLLWLDTTSNEGLTGSGIGHGKPTGNSIPFIINPGRPDEFHTTFVYDPGKDTWQWNMDGIADGKPHEFARLRLTRRR